MKIKSWSVIPCAILTLVACDAAEPDFDARGADVEATRAPLTRLASDDGLVSQNYCDHADRVLRAEFVKSQLEADAELASDRERVLLDDLRAGEAVFAGAERLVLRGADEVRIGFEDGWLVAAAPGVDAPLARLRLADGVKVHVFADDVHKLVLTESIARADIAHLIVMTDLDGAVDVDIEGTPTCLVIDGGGNAAGGPLQVNGRSLGITAAPRPTKLTLVGTDFADTLIGTAGKDTIYAHAGHDYILGGAETDTLLGHEDNDYIDGGSDSLPFGDWMAGGKGDDWIIGSSQTAVCWGQEGYDTCLGCGLNYDCP